MQRRIVVAGTGMTFATIKTLIVGGIIGATVAVGLLAGVGFISAHRRDAAVLQSRLQRARDAIAEAKDGMVSGRLHCTDRQAEQLSNTTKHLTAVAEDPSASSDLYELAMDNLRNAADSCAHNYP